MKEHDASVEIGWAIKVVGTGLLYVPRTWPTRREAIRALRDLLLVYPPEHAWRRVLEVRSAPAIHRKRGGWGRPRSIAERSLSGEAPRAFGAR